MIINRERTNKLAINLPTQEETFIEKVIKIDRVTKVTTGGKRLAFRAFVIIGDLNGNVGLGFGKSKEVPTAIKKALDRAKKHKVYINIINNTIPHEVLAKFGAARVLIKPARPGTGVVAGGAIRILLEAVGLQDVVAKSLGTSNMINNAKAALEALKRCKNLTEETKRRGKKLSVYRAGVTEVIEEVLEPVVELK